MDMELFGVVVCVLLMVAALATAHREGLGFNWRL